MSSNHITKGTLQAGFDGENQRVRKRKRVNIQEQEENNAILAYYGDPFHSQRTDVSLFLSFEQINYFECLLFLILLQFFFSNSSSIHSQDKTKRPLSYPCLFCSRDKSNPVWISHTNPTSNLKAHRDGSTQAGRSSAGCPGWLTAQAQGHKVPLSVADIQALAEAERKKNSGPLDNFVTTTKGSRFDNLTFNQGMCMWLLRQSLPWLRLADPWLRACVKYIRPDTRLYGRQWAAQEAKRVNLLMKKQVIKELQVFLSVYFLFIAYLLLTYWYAFEFKEFEIQILYAAWCVDIQR